ncbi:T9SS type A sorting domain-containing protein [Winogradskyella flava]|uniref:T9SS type A sorting domain-containing protein n=1 Tax=Winogradskyella flava TaxID=1884876 RepID=UPI0024905EDB|nr:T9SS type A sorting domain-containing protein [Winogradskyella flava]
MCKKILLLSLILCSYSIVSQTVSTVTGGNFHDGLAVDSQGNVYGSDFPPVAPFPNPIKNVYKYDTSGNVTVFATGFVSPNGIGINSQDEVYVCDHFANNIKKFSSDGTLLMTTTIGQFTTPAGIKPIPNTLDMLVVEYNNNSGRKIKQLSADGTVTTLFSGAPLNGPAGIAFIGDTPYIANFNDRKIFRFQNSFLTEVAQLPSSNNPQTDFLGFLTSANGLLYATHFGLNSIYTINPTTGEVNLFAGSSQGGQDGDISIATFNGPNGIVADESTGKIYVSDAGVKNLRIIENAFLSTEDFTADSFRLHAFPNPAKDSLKIEMKLNILDPLEIQIIDATGKIIYQKSFTIDDSKFSFAIPTTAWEEGTYILHCIQSNKKITKKIMI